jgi:transcription elongation factor Elf1
LIAFDRNYEKRRITMAEINNCPKCGATVTVDQQYGDGMDVYCSNCGFVYFADPKIIHSIEEVISAWNSQPVIERLRGGIQNTLDLARTGLKPDHYASEVEWLQHKINVIASELAGLLKGNSNG